MLDILEELLFKVVEITLKLWHVALAVVFLVELVARAARPLILLWPWAIADMIFIAYLRSTQGQTVTLGMAGVPWHGGLAGLVFFLSFLATLAACLLTSLVASWPRAASELRLGIHELVERHPTKPKALGDWRNTARLHIAWASVLALMQPVALAAATGSQGMLLLTVIITVAGLLLVYFVLRGSWHRSNYFAERLTLLWRWRWLLVAAVAVLAVVPLRFGASRLIQEPEAFSSLGPVFSAMLGLSGLASLFGAVFVAIPCCLTRPWLGVVGGMLVMSINLATMPAADPLNPLLKEQVASAKKASEILPCHRANSFASSSILRRAVRATASEVKEGREPSLFFISSEGGGIRAAYWTAMGLTQLDETLPNFIPRVAMLSGVSGGSLGITTWLAATDATDQPQQQRRLVADFLGSDLLSPAIGGLLFLDAPRLVLGGLWPEARRDDVFEAALVRRWESVSKSVLGQPSDFFSRQALNLCFRRLTEPPVIRLNSTESRRGSY